MPYVLKYLFLDPSQVLSQEVLTLDVNTKLRVPLQNKLLALVPKRCGR